MNESKVGEHENPFSSSHISYVHTCVWYPGRVDIRIDRMRIKWTGYDGRWYTYTLRENDEEGISTGGTVPSTHIHSSRSDALRAVERSIRERERTLARRGKTFDEYEQAIIDQFRAGFSAREHLAATKRSTNPSNDLRQQT